jgi:hypothetical protein
MSHYSFRFACNVWLTNHANDAMAKRGVDESTILQLIETGELLDKGDGHCWIHQALPGRVDNRICVAVVLGQAVVVKTVMVNWQAKEDVT